MEALRRLDRIGTQVKYAERERVLDEGSLPDRVCVVCQGTLKLTTSSEDGRLLLLRIAGPGDVLGLASVLKGTRYELTAEALETCEVRVIARQEFMEFMEEFREVGWNSAEEMAREYGSAVLSAKRLALSESAAGKLAGLLLEWGRKSVAHGALVDESDVETALRFRMPLTHEELGQMAGISRETVTRVLTKLKDEKLIEFEGERMIVRFPKKLERMYC
jgi:CRP/FNR family transcriptional regulator